MTPTLRVLFQPRDIVDYGLRLYAIIDVFRYGERLEFGILGNLEYKPFVDRLTRINLAAFKGIVMVCLELGGIGDLVIVGNKDRA